MLSITLVAITERKNNRTIGYLGFLYVKTLERYGQLGGFRLFQYFDTCQKKEKIWLKLILCIY